MIKLARLKLAVLRLANRQIDKFVRDEIIHAAGMEPDEMHPAWTSTRNSGLVAKLTAIADKALQNDPSQDGEDLLMATLAHRGQRLFTVAGKAMSKQRFGQPPVFKGHPPYPVETFWHRKIKTIVDKNQYRQNVLETVDLSPPRSDLKFWEVMAVILSSYRSYGRRLEIKMRQLAGNRKLDNAIIDTLVAGRGIRAISGLSKLIGGSGSGGSVRRVHEKFIPAVRKMVQADPELTDLWDQVS